MSKKIKFEDGQILEIKNANFRGYGNKILEFHIDAGANTYENINQIAIFKSHWEHFILIDDDNNEFDYYGFTFFRALDYSPVKQEFVLTMEKLDNVEIENLELKNNLEKKEAENEKLEKLISEMHAENAQIQAINSQMQVENAQIRAENAQISQLLNQVKEQLQLKKSEIDNLKTTEKVENNETNKAQNNISDNQEGNK